MISRGRRSSLVFTLATRNLLQDRLRFVASLVGIIFAVVLIMAQIGLYFGFNRMVTTMIDHASTDLWIVSNGSRYFEDLSLVNTKVGDRLRAINGVAKVIPMVVGFSAWQTPDGPMTPVFVVGSDVTAGGLEPWNIVVGTADSLTASGSVAIDRSYRDRLGASEVGTTAAIRGEPVTVTAVTNGIRSFTTTPYVFSNLDDARQFTGLPASFTTQFLVRVKTDADLERVRRAILANISGIQALTPAEFRQESRSFWLFRTGAGAALVAGAVLGVIIGTVIVAQTLYSSTKDHLYEFATLRAMGASNGYIYKVIISQALINAIIGFSIAALIGISAVHFTAESAVQIVMTPGLMLGLFLLTVVMCIASAIASIVGAIRVDPAIVLAQ